MLYSDSISRAMSMNLFPDIETDITTEIDYFARFQDILIQNHYKYNLLEHKQKSNETSKRNSISEDQDQEKKSTGLRSTRPRSATVPTNRNCWKNMNFNDLTKENIRNENYTYIFWQSDLKAKEHKTYIGYDEDFGPIYASVLSNQTNPVVYINSNWGSSKIIIDNSMIAPSNVSDSLLISPKAFKIVLFLALEKYLEELEEEFFKLKNWQQNINFSSPCYGDNLFKFMSDKRAYQRDFLQEIDSNITLFQLIKSDLPRIISQLELVESEQLEAALKNMDRKMMQKCLNVDVIIHHSGLNRTMEQRDTFNAFLKICGELLVQNGAHITQEELINPKIISEHLEDPQQLKSRRSVVFKELIDTETKYVNKLRAIVEVFIKPLRVLADRGQSFIRHYDIKATFQYIEEILEVNEAFLKDLQEYDPATGNLGDICLRNLSKFGIYEPFISGYRYSLEYNVAQERKNNAYFNFVMKARDHPGCDKLALKDLLVMPVQRLPRYNLLFSDYLRFTPKDDPEYDGLYKALVKVNEISYLSSHKISEKAEELSRLLFSIADCPPKIMSSSRHFVTQFDCFECDITTVTIQENITLFLLSDCLLITKRNKENNSGKKKLYNFISWIDLKGIEVLDAEPYGNLHGLYFKVSLEYSEDLYWDHQEIHLFCTTDPSDKARFYNELITTNSICRAKKNGSSCYRQTISDIDIFFNIYKPELYEKSLHKSDIALHYVEDSAIPITRYFQIDSSALVSGMVKAKDCRFSCSLRSRASCDFGLNNLTDDQKRIFVPTASFEAGKNFQLPFLFQDYFYHLIIYHKILLKNSIPFQSKAQSYHRILMESLFGLHFPSSKVSHQYLSKIRGFSRKLKGDKFILVSNGVPNVNTTVRKMPYKQATHHLGTKQSDHFRELGTKPRSLTDPLKSLPSVIDKLSATARKVTPTKIKIPRQNPISPILSPISPEANLSPNKGTSKVSEEKSASAGRKKRSSLIKVTRFFSWNR